MPTSDGWQPIETAPRDGTWVLLYEADFPNIFVGRFSDLDATCRAHHEWRSNPDHEDGGYEPTHWMPLPEPPPQ